MPSELLPLRRDADDWHGSPLESRLQREIDGEVRFDRATRALYATDSSNYRLVPIGLIVPRTVDAAIAALAICREHDVAVLPRGGGTSLAGQTCNHAVVIDCSRHLTRVEIDAAAGIARVEPGVIMHELRQAARARGWDFGPDPSTNLHCTLGGMLGNNSCGVHSVFSEFYGPGPRTSDHVEELDVVTYRGERVRAGATDERERRRVHGLGGRIAEIYGGLAALRDRYADLIRARYPRMPRIVSGYNLPDLLPERGFHVGRALVGSEATCVLIAGATLRLAPARPARVLAVLGYPDIYAAADAAPAARARRPVGCEAFDDVIADKIRTLEADTRHVLDLLPDGHAWLLVEHGAATRAEALAEAEATARALAPGAFTILHDTAEQDALRDLREIALGVDAFMPGRRDTYEGWEDSAVPPERLGGYLRELHRLYEQYGLHGSLYGHFGQGCVHTRIDFDLAHPEGIERYRRFTRDAARLVVAHGGSLSGEHGDGQSRSDLHEIMFGPELVAAFDEFKQLWDPDHRMNPGKLVRPNPRTSNLRLAGYDPHPGPIELWHGNDGHDFGHAAVRCVGVGKCRKRDTGTMCPSYMVTLDERHTTRGRAHLMFEMLRDDVITDGWQSEEVKEALDLCLACKACKRECPTHVDMAAYKAEFLAHYYERRTRPRQAFLFGRLHRWLGLARLSPRLANLFANTRLAKWFARMAPQRRVPHIARRSFRSTFRPVGEGPRVILWPDTFNDGFQPEVLHAAAAVLAGAGYAVDIPRRRLCCGRTLFEYGWLTQARDEMRQTIEALAPEIEAGVPIVGVEPTCVAAFRDELRALMPGDERAEHLAANVKTLGELLEHAPAAAEPRRVLYHRHCHQQAVLQPEREIALLREAGHDVHVLDSGCCGMAGAFGFERDHYDLSVALAERVLLPAMRAEPDAVVVTDGFSCREQLRQLADFEALHTAQLLGGAGAGPRPDGARSLAGLLAAVCWLVIIIAVLFAVACKREQPAPAPPPPPAAKPPIRGAVADTDLRVMLAELASAKACEMVRGRFRGLRATERPGVATGVLWTRDCKITNQGTDVTFRLGGHGWQWAEKSKQKAGGTFELAQYVPFAFSVTMPGTLDLAYDRKTHVVSLWFTPRGKPAVQFEPVGDFDVDAEGAWSSIVGALGSIFASSPEELAEVEAGEQGTQEFEHTLADGLAVTVNLCTGLMRFDLGRRPKGTMQPPDVGETKRVPVVLHPGGIVLAGPQRAADGMTIHAETGQGAARIALVCQEEAEAVAAAFVASKPLPAYSVLGQVDVRGRAKLSIEPTTCPVIALAQPLESRPVTVAWLRLPSEIARSTGGPLIQCN